MDFWLLSVFYIVILGLICGIVLWYYLNIIRPFSKLPSFRLELCLLQLLFNKEKYSTLIFQKLIYWANLCQNEGLFVGWLFKPYLFIFNEEDMKNVLNENISKTSEYKFLREAYGDGLLICDEVLWRKRRKVFNPVFRTKMVMDKIPIFNKCSKKLVHDLTEMQSKTFVDVEKLIKKFSFNAIYEAILRTPGDDLPPNSEIEMIIELTDKCADFINQRTLKPWLYFMTLFPEGRAYQRNIQKLDEWTRKQLMGMKEAVSQCITKARISDDSDDESAEFNKSFAEALFELHDFEPNFTVEDMISEIKLFLGAGYDTVAFAFNCLLFLLGKHPEVQDRVYEEMAALEGDLSFKDLQNLVYMENVIMETLRLYPSVPVIARSLKSETQCGKYRFPKGTAVVVLVYMHNRNPKVFKDPNNFDPDRFLGKNASKIQWTNIAFSTGIRNCLGQKFAMLEMKIALAHILRKFKIVSHGEFQDSKLGWEVILKAEQPLLMKFTPRRDILRD